MKILGLIIILIAGSSFYSFANYDYNENCQKAFQEILSLRTQNAREILKQEKITNPGNSYILFLEHYCDALELIVTDDPSRFDKFYENYYKRREIMDHDDPSSPYHNLLKAEMLFHVGLAQLKYGNKINAASKIYSSYFLIKDNEEEYPGFILNKKMSGAYNVIFGNIPNSVRWVARMIGLKGNMYDGLSELMSYYNQVKSLPGYAEESVLFINFAHKYTWDEKRGLDFFSGLDSTLSACTLIKYYYANLASFAGKNDLALELLSSMENEHYQVPFYGIDYLLGRCKLNRLDPDAGILLAKFLNEAPGQDYKKDICNRLSYFYLINRDTAKYREYKARVSQVGSDLRDRDREAILESERDYTPSVTLLKARFLFDGGYYDLAETIIETIPVSELSIKPCKLEYLYRKGRIYQEKGDVQQAVDYLKATLSSGEDDPYPFATLAAYQLGMIYEKQNDYPKALEYFEKCLDIFDSDYTVESIENQAEKGMDRVK